MSDLASDTPMQSQPSLALLTFGLGVAATGGLTIYGWLRLAVQGTIHPGHYGGLRTSHRTYAPTRKA